MTQLSTADMKLIDSIFGMYSGYVLDFSNDRFASFFNRDLNIDIYNARYAMHGGSKGKVFRGFLEISSNVEVVRALTALWEYRENYRLDHNESETVPQARQRLSQLVVKLGGKPLPAGFDEPTPTAPPQPEASKEPSEVVQAALEEEFLAMTQMGDHPQQRGYAFERFLKKWFDAWGLDAQAAFTTKSEQVDGSFQLDGATYLVEAKWHTKPTNGAMLHGFQGKLLERPDWTRGLYVSYGGYSDESFEAFTARRLIMMDGTDIYHTLHRRLDLGIVIAKKVRHHSEHRQPFAKVTDLF
ncbi:restriction endonuclease [Devosia sp. WQ 349]|uniref:restriction endonuclease n=1 Tax=Devosia sp. WQ 349K1 TaxID=2800329 RepID=UPI001903FA38|nr:restriction endonuclease [Devosia sp. WQ 349K1]MBK1793297.1 restriction endonuclease [Devosia sp. WQ 349K1]